MGHRIVGHAHDVNLHGHRFKLRVEVRGEVSAATGLVVDFGDIKKFVNIEIVEKLDHAFMLAKDDEIMMRFFAENQNLKHVIVDDAPTSEVILLWIQNKIQKPIEVFGVQLSQLTLWESESSSASLDF